MKKQQLCLAVPLICFVVFVSVVLAGCTSTPSANSVSFGSGKTTPVPEPTTYSLNEAATLKGKTITILSAAEYKQENQYIKPKEGNKYYTVEVLIKNDSDEAMSYNTLNFTLQDNNKYTYTTAFMGKEPALNSGDLQPSREVRGFVTFEVPKTAENFELLYDASWWSNKQLIFKLY